MKLIPRTFLFLGGLLAPLVVADQVTCSAQESENLLANPSFEDGTGGWTDSFAGASAKSGDGTQGTHAVLGTTSLAQVFQTLTNLQVGVEYTASVDYKPYMSPSTALQKTCIVYLIHDDALTSNIIQYRTQLVNRHTNVWQSLSGTYAPTKSTMVLRLINNCGTPATPLFEFRWDNAVFKAPPTQVCATSLDPTTTTTSEASTTDSPTTTTDDETTTTTSESQSTTETQTTTESQTSTESKTTFATSTTSRGPCRL